MPARAETIDELRAIKDKWNKYTKESSATSREIMVAIGPYDIVEWLYKNPDKKLIDAISRLETVMSENLNLEFYDPFIDDDPDQ